MRARLAAAVVLVLLAAACTQNEEPSAAPSTTPAGTRSTTGTTPTGTAPPGTTPGATTPGATTPESTRTTPTPTEPVETHDGSCPYLPTQFVMYTVGQHLTRTTVTTAEPPVCAFYRPDAEAAATVTPSRVASPRAARLRVLAAVGDSGNPLPDLGDGGVVKVVQDGALLAASRGRLVVVVKINQQSSLQATEIARKVFETL